MSAAYRNNTVGEFVSTATQVDTRLGNAAGYNVCRICPQFLAASAHVVRLIEQPNSALKCARLACAYTDRFFFCFWTDVFF